MPRWSGLGLEFEGERSAPVCPVWLALLLGEGLRVLHARCIGRLGYILSSVVPDTINGLGMSGLVLGVYNYIYV